MLTQYVSMKMEFGTDEFFSVYDTAAGGEENVPKRIGKPTLFVFAPNGDVVFAGCNGTSGIKIDDDFKQTLINGIVKTGRIVRPAVEVSDGNEFNKRLRKLVSSKKTLEAAAALSEVYSTNTPQTGLFSEANLNELSELTGVALTPPSLGAKVDKQATKLFTKAQKMVATEIKSVKRKKKPADQAAVVVERIQQAFVGFAGSKAFFEEKWKELEKESGVANLQANAKQFIAAETQELAPTTPDESNVPTTDDVD